MATRWRMLLVLFLARTAMAAQFQAVGALSPIMRDVYGVGLADIGFLIGLYFAPGLALALPGGALGRRFGDKPIVVLGLGLMTLGGLIAYWGPSWEAQMAARISAGVGGILLNVLMSKMIADWFAGREISLAMAIFTNSWPLGIALALIALPPLAEAGGLEAAAVAIIAATADGLALVAAVYRAPESAGGGGASGGRLGGAALLAVIVAGSIWGLYNAALSMTFSFGPEVFAAKGYPVAEAAAAASVILWLLALGSPLGGWLADRTGRRGLVLVIGNLAFAAAMLAAAESDQVVLLVFVVGAVSGLAVGPMMSLPAAVLSPAQRAIGMGVFFTLHYGFSLGGPVLGGALAEMTGDPADAFRFGAGLLLCSVALLAVYQPLAARAKAGSA